MSGRIAILALALCANTAALVGCHSDDDDRVVFTNDKNGGGGTNNGNPPTNPNDGNGPDSVDGTKDNTIHTQATTSVVGTQTLVVFTATFKGDPHDPSDPGKNGTLPEPDIRFQVEFDYKLPDGSRTSVIVELSTHNPQKLTGNSGGPRVIHPTDPDVRVTVRTLNGTPPAPGTPGQTLVNNQQLPTSSTAGQGFSFGFDNPT